MGSHRPLILLASADSRGLGMNSCDSTNELARRVLVPLLLVASVVVVVLPGTASAQTVPTGYLEVCKEAEGTGVTGIFAFQVSGMPGTVSAPVGSCTGLLTRPVGQVTITEVAQPGYVLSGVRTDPFDRLVSQDLSLSTATATIVSGASTSQTIVYFRNRADTTTTTTTTLPPTTTTTTIVTPTTVPGETGAIQICSEAGGPAVTDSFDYTVSSLTGFATVPVGDCSPEFPAPVGFPRVTQAARAGFVLEAVSTEPVDALLGYDTSLLAADVEVVAGQTTRVTFRNQVVQGRMKICQIAGDGVADGTVFTFAFGGGYLTVPAGPASQGGYCTVDGLHPVGTVLLITQEPVPDTLVSAIAVDPSDRIVGAPDLAGGSVSVTVGTDVTEVTFTDRSSTPTPTTTTTTTIMPTTTTTIMPTTTTTTKPPVAGCTFTQGYYKNHSAVVKSLLAGNGGTLTVGGVALSPSDILTILKRSVSGNYLVALSHQLVTARLNQLGGASTPPAVADAIAAADALVLQRGGPLQGTAKPGTTVTYQGTTYTASQMNDTLDGYNNGKARGGPCHCG